MAGTLYPDFLPEVNLRDADIYESVRTEVTSSNIGALTTTTNVIQFDPADTFEVLAVALHVIVAVTADATATVPPRAARQRHSFDFLVTTLETFNGAGDRGGDYGAFRVFARSSEAWEDETNGTGGVANGAIAEAWWVMDPGRDQAETPLVLQEGDQINVHKQIVQPGIAADEEAHQMVTLMVWGSEVPQEQTEVRTEFPSREGGTTI